MFAGCGGDSSPQPPTPPPQAEERITGSERLGWDQQGASIDELASFHYAIYVDDVRSELPGVTCADTAGPQGFACSARLPTLSSGSHTLQLATFVVDGDVLESGRSAAIQVVVGPATILNTAERWRTGQFITTADNVRLRIERVADDLDEPTDLGFAPDGRVFVAEKPGRIRIVPDGQPQSEAVLELDLRPSGELGVDVSSVERRQAQVHGELRRRVEDAAATGDGGLLALAVDPQFHRTGFVYALYTARAPGGSVVFRLARFREANGTFGQRAVLLDDIPARPGRAAASLRFGMDEKLYAILDDGGNPSRGADLSSYNGKILRLNPDGTTPTDQMGGSPLFASAVRWPRGMDWQPTTGTLWIADGVTDRSEHLKVVRNGNASTRRVVEAKYALPGATGVASMTFYRSSAMPAFGGDLFMAAEQGRHILRLQFDPRDHTTIVASERLLENLVGPLRVVGISPRGEIYFGTRDALGRLVQP